MITSMRMNEETTRCPMDHSCHEDYSTLNPLPGHAASGTCDSSSLFSEMRICAPSSPPFPPLSDTVGHAPPDCTNATTTTATSGSSSQQSYSSTHSTQSYIHHCSDDPFDVQRIRSETKRLLILCLFAQCSSSANNNDNTNNQRNRMVVESLAEKLEHVLFDMAPTLADYSALPTLPLRLSLILPRVKKEWKKSNSHFWRKNDTRMKKQEQQRDDQQEGDHKQRHELQHLHRASESDCSTAATMATSSSSRSGDASTRGHLRQQLGEIQYQSIQELVETIRFERNQFVGASCTNCRRCQRPPPPPPSRREQQEAPQGYDGGKEDKEASPSPLLPAGHSFGTKLDPPVAHLFFYTPLVVAWEKSTRHGGDGDEKRNDGGRGRSSEALPVVPSTIDYWTQLQRQAQANLEAFLEWKAELRSVCPAPR